MELKKLGAHEVTDIRRCLEGLADHHNSITSEFSGAYPTFSISWTTDHMKEQLEMGKGVLYAIFENGTIAGCVYSSVEERVGSLEILYLDESVRGKGYGDILMDKAMIFFRERGVDIVDIRVINGNPAVSFYEKYGFKLRTLVMSKLMDDK